MPNDIRLIEPAADDEAIRAACDELEVAGIIRRRVDCFDFPSQAPKLVRRQTTECWYLASAPMIRAHYNPSSRRWNVSKASTPSKADENQNTIAAVITETHVPSATLYLLEADRKVGWNDKCTRIPGQGFLILRALCESKPSAVPYATLGRAVNREAIVPHLRKAPPWLKIVISHINRALKTSSIPFGIQNERNLGYRIEQLKRQP